MPKLLIGKSEKKPKERFVATSIQNFKKMVTARIEKDAEDTTYEIHTVNVKMKLKNIVAMFNLPWKKLKKHDWDTGEAVDTQTLTVSESGRMNVESEE